MQLIIKMCGFSITGVIILTMLGNFGGAGVNMQNIARLVLGSVILLAFLPQIATVFQLISNLASLANINDAHLRIILKIIGLSYVVEFATAICTDMGETAIAKKVDLAGKIGIMILATPVINAFIYVIQGLLKSL